ncbi:unnamed protein product [Symbiodinium sp. CCMP2456]|nr:unnamed protein product [Symbiodinium sp. CCMP2456]
MPRGIFVPAQDLWREPGQEIDNPPERMVQPVFLIMAQDYLSELVAISLWTPVEVQQALAEVQHRRTYHSRRRMPTLVPVHPQPVHEYALVLALPEWATDRVCVAFDLSRLDGRVFAKFTSPRLDYASILVLAGLFVQADVVIYVHEHPLPLQPGQVVDLATGFCITITCRTQLHFAVFDLRDMLQSPEGWNAQAVVPTTEGSWLYILGDEDACHFRLYPERRDNLRGDLSERLGYDLRLLQVKPPVQQIVDHYEDGVHASQVAVVTQQRIRREAGVPFRNVMLLDLRPLLLGLTWQFAPFGQILAQYLYDRYSEICPAGYRVSVIGRPFHTDDGLFFTVDDGEVIVVEFVLNEVEQASDLSSDTDSTAQTSSSTSSEEGGTDHQDGHGPAIAPQTIAEARSTGPDNSDEQPPQTGDYGGQSHQVFCAPRSAESVPQTRSHVDAEERGLQYWEASTLLETLSEHFAAKKHEEDQPRHLCMQLELDSLLPRTPYQGMVESLSLLVPRPFPDPTPAKALLTEDWLDNDLRPLLQAGFLDAQWRDVFSALPRWHTSARPADATQIVIYTDGSADGGRRDSLPDGLPAAWAFAVWAAGPDGETFIGYSSHAAVHSDSAFHVGECADTPMESELLAICWAMVWILDAGLRFGLPFELRYDCTGAGGSTFATSSRVNLQSVDGYPTLADFASLLRQVVETRQTIHHTHVKGHAGVIGNELCDALSKQARKGREDPHERCLPVWPAELRKHPCYHWSWLVHQVAQDLPTLWALESEACRLQTLPAQAHAPRQGVHNRTDRAVQVEFRFKVFTYNVLTMFDPLAPKGKPKRQQNLGMLIAGKRDILKRQLGEAQVWLAGFQETRIPTTGILPDSEYLMISAGATERGHGGCALWISRKHPFGHAGDQALSVQDDQVTVTSSSPRHLQVIIETPKLMLVVLVVHAPRVAYAGEAAVTDFWRDRAADIAKSPGRAEFLVLADANAHVGSVTTEAVGPWGAEEENMEGVAFHDFLLSVNGYVPSTWEAHHTGQHWTWASPDHFAAHHRLDFVVTPKRWEDFQLHSSVWHTFEALQTRQDHLPVTLDIGFSRRSPATSYTSGKRKVCRPGAITAEQGKELEARLRHGLAIPWHCEVDDHNEAWTSVFKAYVQPYVPKPTVLPTQPYLQPGTLDLVTQRKALRRHVGHEEAERSRRLKVIGFAAWVLYCRGRSLTEATRQTASHWLIEIDYSIAFALELLRERTRAIRAAVRRDRNAYLEG